MRSPVITGLGSSANQSETVSQAASATVTTAMAAKRNIE
jgi:hypothetical protein